MKLTQLCPTLCAPMDCTVHAILQARILEWIPPPGDLPNPGTEPRSPALQADSLLSESPGKPKNTGVGNLSLLQGIFLTQESNRGLLHCRWILYQLSYKQSLHSTRQQELNKYLYPLIQQSHLCDFFVKDNLKEGKSFS